ncbi:MAG: pilus assembly PilX N-terminal domain-containing protein [Thermodesulfobacteriota bacterium]|nr:pilus assembly PilX N-terminal domain-containing protein [Thermodesulfobacteriota bacterium]
MRQVRFILKNENGSVMVVGILVLMLASLIGVAAITTSTIEVEVTGNHKLHKENFYRAEGAAMLAAQLLEDERDGAALCDLPYGQPDPENPAAPPDLWFRNDLSGFPDPDNVANDYNWDPYINGSGEAPLDDSGKTRFMAIHKGYSGTSSVRMDGSGVHTIALYGRSKKEKGSALIEMGYKKRY